MRVTGHIPALVHLSGALQARQDLEHTDKLVFDMWGHNFDTTRIVLAGASAGGNLALLGAMMMSRDAIGDVVQLIGRGDAALASGQTYQAIEAFSGALALRPVAEDRINTRALLPNRADSARPRDMRKTACQT